MCTPQSRRAIDPARSINVRVASIAASPLSDQLEIVTPAHALRLAGRKMQRHVPATVQRLGMCCNRWMVPMDNARKRAIGARSGENWARAAGTVGERLVHILAGQR